MLRRAECRGRQRTRRACPGRTAFRKRRVRCSRAALPPLRLTGRTVRRSAEPAASTAEPPQTHPLQPPARTPASLHPPPARILPHRRLLAQHTLSPVRPPSPLNPPCALCAQTNLLLLSDKFLRVFRELFSKSSLNGARGGAPALPRQPQAASPRPATPPVLRAHILRRPSVRFHLFICPAPSAHKLTCFFPPKSF